MRACNASCEQTLTTQHKTAQHGTAQHSTAQHSTAQHSTAQHSTAQHSTAQHSTALTHMPSLHHNTCTPSKNARAGHTVRAHLICGGMQRHCQLCRAVLHKVAQLWHQADRGHCHLCKDTRIVQVWHNLSCRFWKGCGRPTSNYSFHWLCTDLLADGLSVQMVHHVPCYSLRVNTPVRFSRHVIHAQNSC